MSKGGKPAAKKGTVKGKPSKIDRSGMTEEEIQDLRETFDLFDDDKSGTIDAHEITKALENTGVEQRNPIVYKMILDLQEINGPIDFDLFIDTICNRLGNNKDRDGIQKLFNLFDLSGDGNIDFEKLKRVAKDLGETMNDEEIDEMMHHIHVLNKTKNRDEIVFDDYYKILTKNKY